MKHRSQMMAAVLLGSLSLTGCMKDKSPDPAMVPDRSTGRPESQPAAAATPAKEMTHVITADQPCYMTPGGKTCGTLAAGTKVLLLIPNVNSMAQIETADGKTLYTKLDAIEPVTAPPPPAIRPQNAQPAPAPVVEPKPTPDVAPKAAAKPMPATKPAEMAKAKEMTHMLSADQPYYMSRPMGSSPKPAGMLKKGTQVLLLIPGESPQVETPDGKQVYTPIDGLELMPAK